MKNGSDNGNLILNLENVLKYAKVHLTKEEIQKEEEKEHLDAQNKQMKQDVASKDEVIEYTQKGVDDAFEEIEKTLKARTTSSNVKSRMVTSFVNSQLRHENPMYESRYNYVRSEGRTAQTAAG